MNSIALLNDMLRRTFSGGKVVMTLASPRCRRKNSRIALERVRQFDEFDADNDPHKEHDFGDFELDGEKYFFKIDYYSPDMQGGSEDPSDPQKTTRVLTIMRADEY